MGDYSCSQPASLPNILNAGWAYDFHGPPEMNESGVDIKMEKLNLLILKAIETSFVHETYGTKFEARAKTKHAYANEK